MKIRTYLVVGVMYFVFSTLGQASSAPAAEEESKAVQEAAEGFYSALNATFRGDSAPMRSVWSHADDVIFMGPDGGYLKGWEQVLGEWEKHSARKIGGKIQAKEMKVIMGRDLAIVTNFEVGENMGADGKPFQVSIRATNVFRKENGEWKMIEHHTDLIPALRK